MRQRKRLQLRRQDKKGYETVPEDTHNKVTDNIHDMVVFGYSGRIFNEKEMPRINRIDLIQLENSHRRDAAVFVDRYDIRHLVLSSGANEEGVGDRTLEDDALNLIRYKTLYSLGEDGIMSETDIFDMDPEERHAYIDYLSHSDEQENYTPVQNPQGSSGGISLQYDASGAPLSGQITENSSSIDTDDQNDKDSCSKADEKAFVPTFAVPDGVALPTTQRHFEIIERTARFLADQQDSNKAAQMEIVIQGKQGTNADFEFLNRSSHLHSFYKHILWLMQTGLYGYNHDSSSEPDTEPEENNAIEAYLQPQNAGNKAEDLDPPVAEPNNVSVPDGVAIPADPNRRLLIDKVARLQMNEDEDPRSFASTEEEIQYWRDTTFDLRDMMVEKELELEAFKQDSTDLEMEFEKEISRLEAVNKELRAKNEKYKFDIEELKDKYQKAQLKAGEDLQSIERELQFVRSQQEYYRSRTRELEQNNDDLERSERMTKSSLQTVECRLSQAMEENTFLHKEVETKNILVDEVQRLKDELKDLNLELNVVRSRNSRAVPQNPGLSKSMANVDGSGQNPAVVVHDIMSRVKELETRISGARTKVTPLINTSGQYAALQSRIARSRSIASPKITSSLLLGNGAGADAPQMPTSMRTISTAASGEPQGFTSYVMESKLEKARKMRELTKRNRSETVRNQTVPQRIPPA
ncbi:NADH:ubiquinone oxidoreductase [Coemansia sp. RSA 1939]|nr:NADH:ubiquinone oxidoreductase [Coemansia sp. RSA 1939]